MLLLAVTAFGCALLGRPGVAIALMLLLGRQSFDVGFQFPLVSLPIFSLLAVAIWRKRTLSFPPLYILVPFLWTGIYTLSRPYYSNTSDHQLDVSIALYMLLAIVPMTVAISTFDGDVKVVRDFGRSVVVLAVALAAIAMVTSGGQRTGALGGGPITLAQTAALGAVVVAVNLAGVRTGVPRIVYVPTFFFLSYAVVWSQSRGPTIALGLAVVTLLTVRRSAKLPGVKMLGSVAMLFVSFRVLERFDLLPRRLSRLSEFQSEVSRSRGVVWDPALEIIANSPILGCGADCYNRATGGRFTYPHNVFLEAQILGGIVGFALISWSIYRLSKRLVESDPWAFCVFLVPLVSALLSGDIYNNRSIWVTGLLLIGAPTGALADATLRDGMVGPARFHARRLRHG